MRLAYRHAGVCRMAIECHVADALHWAFTRVQSPVRLHRPVPSLELDGPQPNKPNLVARGRMRHLVAEDHPAKFGRELHEPCCHDDTVAVYGELLQRYAREPSVQSLSVPILLVQNSRMLRWPLYCHRLPDIATDRPNERFAGCNSESRLNAL